MYVVKKIAIVDPIGKKAGMDYYNLSLLENISKNCKNIETFLYSNFEKGETRVKIYKFFDFLDKHNSLQKILSLYSGYIHSFISCKKNNIEFVILHIFSCDLFTLSILLLAKLFNLKVISIIHDIKSFGRKDARFAKRLIYNNLSKFVVVHNEFSKKELLKDIKLRKTRIHIIKHGGYIEYVNRRFSKEEARKILGFSNSNVYILFFGQIKKVKGLDLLIKAFAKVKRPGIKLIIAGKPWKTDFSQYQRLIDEYKLGHYVIKKVGYIDDKERDLLFHACDICVIPYRIIFQSGVLLMAMSYGMAVIASDLEPNREIIKSGVNGLLFKSGSVEDLARKIEILLNDSDLRRQMSLKAIETIERDFSWKDIALEYIKKIIEIA